MLCCGLHFSFLITSAEFGTTGRVVVQPWNQSLPGPCDQALSMLKVQTFILLGLFFPEIDTIKVSPAQRFCLVCTPKDRETWNLRKQVQDAFLCLTEGINVFKKLWCTPCPIGSPFLQPSKRAQGWPESSKMVARMTIHGSHRLVLCVFWK